MLALLPALRSRPAALAAAVGLGVALLTSAAAADTPPDLPPLGAPSAQPAPGAPGAAPAPRLPGGPGAAGAPAPGAPGAPAAPLPPGLSWMSPAELPPGYPQPYPGYYPMPYQQPIPRQESYVLPPPPPREHRSTAMFASGVLMVSGGLVGVIAGSVLISSSSNRIDIYCDSPSFPCAHKDDATRKGGGVALMAIGAVVSAAGIPLWIMGSRLVLVRKDEKRPALLPVLRVGAGTASVAVSF